MDEKMETALLKVCEKNAKILSPDVIQFIRELINVSILTSENKIDDIFLPVINPILDVADKYLLEQADKIYEEEPHD